MLNYAGGLVQIFARIDDEDIKPHPSMNFQNRASLNSSVSPALK